DPWPLSGKLIFWPVSLILSFILVVIYVFLVMHICYSTAGAGSYLINNKLVILAASVGFFAILFLLEFAVRGHNRHLRLEEFCISVYIIPVILYAVLLVFFKGQLDNSMQNSIDALDNDAALLYYYTLLMLYYTAISLVIRGFVAFLALMNEYSKMKKYKNNKRK
ncbi:MAG: hypothetical protein J6T47_04610, partial [Lachnospiraceae bacterium]|nr:hypothetical protein [Lachnospiraceae bacterium]